MSLKSDLGAFIHLDSDVGIGTTAPDAKLDVNGQLKIRGGVPGGGKVLTSDALGLATWEHLPTPDFL